MNALKRALYLQAALWALAAVLFALVPKFLLHSVFGEPKTVVREVAWLRILGVQMLGLAMFMVLVAHRIKDLWWWAWAFAVVNVAVAGIVVINAAFGVEIHQNRAFWWSFAGVMVVIAFGSLYGLFVSSREQPLL